MQPIKFYIDPVLIADLPNVRNVSLLYPIVGVPDETGPDRGRWDKWCAQHSDVFSLTEQPDKAEAALIPWPLECIPVHFMDRLRFFCRDMAEKNLPVVAFLCEDNDTPQIWMRNMLVFRTSILKSKQHVCERAWPAFHADIGYAGTPQKPEKPSMGFCGFVSSPRVRVVSHLLDQQKALKFEGQLRAKFFGFLSPEQQTEWRRDYIRILGEHLYSLCIRGGGNFSYRLYETMCAGRIPVIVDTDCSLPLPDVIDWEKQAVIVPYSKTIGEDVVLAVNAHFETLDQSSLCGLLMKNRTIWEECLSPHGFYRHVPDVVREFARAWRAR